MGKVRSDAIVEDVDDLDFVLTLKKGEFRLFMGIVIGDYRTRMVPVSLDGLIAKSIVRDLIKETNYAETNESRPRTRK